MSERRGKAPVAGIEARRAINRAWALRRSPTHVCVTLVDAPSAAMVTATADALLRATASLEPAGRTHAMCGRLLGAARAVAALSDPGGRPIPELICDEIGLPLRYRHLLCRSSRPQPARPPRGVFRPGALEYMLIALILLDCPCIERCPARPFTAALLTQRVSPAAHAALLACTAPPTPPRRRSADPARRRQPGPAIGGRASEPRPPDPEDLVGDRR